MEVAMVTYYNKIHWILMAFFLIGNKNEKILKEQDEEDVEEAEEVYEESIDNYCHEIEEKYDECQEYFEETEEGAEKSQPCADCFIE